MNQFNFKNIPEYEELYIAKSDGFIISLNYNCTITADKIRSIIKEININKPNEIMNKYKISKFFFYKIKKDPNKYLNKNKPLKQQIGNHGYLYVTLCKNGKHKKYLVHQLILMAFKGLCPDGMEARHLDGNRLNNNIKNLEWPTRSINATDKTRHGTNIFVKLDNKKAKEIRKLRSDGMTLIKLATKFNVGISTIWSVIHNETWKYINEP